MSRKGSTISVLIITILLVIANTILDKTMFAYGQTNPMNSNLTSPIASSQKMNKAILILAVIMATVISLLDIQLTEQPCFLATNVIDWTGLDYNAERKF